MLDVAADVLQMGEACCDGVCQKCSLKHFCTGTDVSLALYYEVLCHEILYHEILYHEILYHEIQYHEILYHEIQYHEMLYHEMLYHEILYHEILADNRPTLKNILVTWCMMKCCITGTSSHSTCQETTCKTCQETNRQICTLSNYSSVIKELKYKHIKRSLGTLLTDSYFPEFSKTIPPPPSTALPKDLSPISTYTYMYIHIQHALPNYKCIYFITLSIGMWLPLHSHLVVYLA